MNPFKTGKFKISRGPKPIFKLLPRQRILNLLRQNNQKDHNIQLDNPLIDATNYHRVSTVPASHCSFDQMSNVSE